MKLEVGMYVRTLDGIFKVIEVKDNGVMSRFVNEWGNVYFPNDMMCNPSHKIIDLIEVDDYVNGYKVVGVDREKGTVLCGVFREFNKGNIETIVTKEQFENIIYKVA